MIKMLEAIDIYELMHNYKIPDDRIVVIPGGVDLERFYPATEKKEIKND